MPPKHQQSTINTSFHVYAAPEPVRNTKSGVSFRFAPSFSDIATLRMHCRHKHKPVIRHNCDECPETFSSKSNLNRHLTEEHDIVNFNVKRANVDTIFSCYQCNFVTKRKYNLQQHKLKLHRSQSDLTSCDICSKTFKYISNLRRHFSNSHQPQLIKLD